MKLTFLRELELDRTRQEVVGAVARDLRSERATSHESESEVFIRNVWRNVGDV